MSPSDDALQDHYPEDVAHCYGCGPLNEEGLQLKTRWDGDETVSRFTPEPHQTAMPGWVYGGLIASLLDCHGTGTASAAALRREGKEIGEAPSPRYVTGRLEVDYLRPTPMGPELVIRGRVEEMTERKVVVSETLSARGEVCARGRVVAVRMPESFGETGPPE